MIIQKVENVEPSHQDGTLFWSKRNLTPAIHIFDDQNSGVKANLNPNSTPSRRLYDGVPGRISV